MLSFPYISATFSIYNSIPNPHFGSRIYNKQLVNIYAVMKKNNANKHNCTVQRNYSEGNSANLVASYDKNNIVCKLIILQHCKLIDIMIATLQGDRHFEATLYIYSFINKSSGQKAMEMLQKEQG